MPLGALLLARCANGTPPDGTADPARLVLRNPASIEPIAAGRHPLGLGNERDGFLYVPGSCGKGQPIPLLVLLHGAGQRAEEFAAATEAAERLGVMLVVPDSRGGTWDRIRGNFGPDVDFIEAALQRASRHCAVDPKRIGMGGFSDGATYGLSLGLSNGDLITHVLAFSPGFTAPSQRRGRPRVYVTHGTDDRILPIGSTSRRIVPSLRADGYEVTYQEFDGGHQVPRALANAAFEWFVTP